MKSIKFEYPPGATPLDPNEIAGLKPSYISTQRELNAAEQDNILQGENWIFASKRKNFLTEKFFRDSHKKMFGHVWSWAGKYRTTDKSIGVTWSKIPEEMHKLIGDVSYWMTHETYPLDEIAARLHHRLVWVHPFANGNGRWARAMADALLSNMGRERFSWGAKQNLGDLSSQNENRKSYIRALQMADSKKYEDLLRFVRA